MKNNILLLLLLIISTSILNAQNDSHSIIEPILLDKSVLSGVGLKKVKIKNEPEKDFYQKKIFGGQDLSIYVVSTETWNNKMVDFPFDEFIYMYHGEALVKPDKGQSQLFHTGDYFFAPQGYTGEWEIRAGSNLHYELSVIATKRSKQIEGAEEDAHILFDKSKLSGKHIEFDAEGQYSELLKKGNELTITLCAEKPSESMRTEPSKEMLIQVLAGQITIGSSDDKMLTFYSGDFFVIPKGFVGKWKSEGHGLVKYLMVERTV